MGVSLRETPTPAETHRRDDGKGCDRSLIDLNSLEGVAAGRGNGVSRAVLRLLLRVRL